MELRFTPYQVDIFTASYQIQGELRPRGNPNIFINDQAYQTLTFYDSTLKPIMPGAKVGAMQVPELYVPKVECHLLHVRDYSAADAQILPTKFRLICFTESYIIRGDFHTGPETKPSDIFYSTPNVFYPATDVEVFPVRALGGETTLKVGLAYVARDTIVSFYEQPA